MLRAERQKIILDFVNSKGIASIEDLMHLANISKATAHRYINTLDEMHLLTKIRGGAKSLNNDFMTANEPSMNAKSLMNKDEKRRIAKAAVELINPQDHIILDSGTTVLELAKLIGKDIEGTIITNDLYIANELSNHSKISALLVGGMIRTGFYSTYGYFAEEILKSMVADKLFFSVDAISHELEMMHYAMDDLNIKRICLSRARERILLCDHSKFSAKALFAIDSLNSVDTIIVGKELDIEMQRKLQQLDKKIIFV